MELSQFARSRRGSELIGIVVLAAGVFLGTELNHAASANLNASGAAIVLVTAILVGLLLATRISLGALFLAMHRQLVDFGRALSLQWARFTERRRKERMKDNVLRKHIEKEAPALRLVTEPAAHSDEEIETPLIREVQGAGRFQIRKVTKADLRKAAEALAQQPTHDPFLLYPGGGQTPPPVR